MGSHPRHPLWTRLLHLFNMLVLLLMAASGCQIYNANPVLGGRQGATIPAALTLGGWLAGGRYWHFGLMGLFALVLGSWLLLLLSLRRRRLALAGDLQTLGASGNAGRRRLAGHRLIYSLMLALLALALLTGLAMFKPASLWWLSGLFGSWQTLRLWHFATVPAMALLVLAHGLMAWRVGGWRLLRTMGP
ncbi:MAG: cytochrome b/b6 domain-containing protein [Cyanobacteriota bacterium]|nr:cytochrome b/b6 domain-containing protein [Cyanobacteriota bacterium]